MINDIYFDILMKLLPPQTAPDGSFPTWQPSQTRLQDDNGLPEEAGGEGERVAKYVSGPEPS